MSIDGNIALHPLTGTALPDLSFAEIPHPEPFCCSITIDSAHLSDVVAHVNNIEIVRWLDRTAELHADAGGFTRQQLLVDGIMWFVARHEIDYLTEAFGGNELILATWIRSISRVKAWRDYCIIRPADTTIICRATTLWVLVNLDSRRPTRITDEMVRHFAPPIVAPTGSAEGASCISR